MKKIIRLTESDLVRLVKKVIMEDDLSSPKPNCRNFKYDPNKKIYDNENDYNCAVKYWEDAVNLYKAYVFQKENVNWKQLIKDFVKTLNDMGRPETFATLLAKRNKNMGKPGSNLNQKFGTDYNELSKNSNPGNADPPDANYGDIKIMNYYKQLKFNFPIAIGIYSSPDLVHKYLKPKGTYFDGIAESPIYGDPGEKPTLSTNNPITPQTPSPEDVRKTIAPPPEKVTIKPNSATNFSVTWREDLPTGKVEQNTHYFPNYEEWAKFTNQFDKYISKNENNSKTSAQALYSQKLNLSKDKTY